MYLKHEKIIFSVIFKINSIVRREKEFFLTLKKVLSTFFFMFQFKL